MPQTRLTADDEGQLAQLIRHQWTEAHGVAPGAVHVLADAHCIVVWIDEVLSPAERAILQWQHGQELLQRYTDQLLVTIRPALRSEVEAVTGRVLLADNLWADPASQRITCVYQLGVRKEMTSRIDPAVASVFTG